MVEVLSYSAILAFRDLHVCPIVLLWEGWLGNAESQWGAFRSTDVHEGVCVVRRDFLWGRTCL